MPGIPEVGQEALLAAMERFDRELRGTAEWVGWEQRAKYKFAIEHNGHRYPVKRIISLATGYPVGNFSGGVISHEHDPP